MIVVPERKLALPTKFKQRGFIMNPFSFGGGFPIVAASNNGTDAASGTSASVQLPAGIASGNLLLIFCAFGSNTSAHAATGWTVGLSDVQHLMLYKIASGSEGSSVTVTWNSSTENYFRSVRISGAHASAPPEAALFNASSINPNPPSLTPTWGAKNTLWFASCAPNTDASAVYPTNYTDNQYRASGLRLIMCSRNLNAASEDPGTFTQASSNTYRAMTTAVRPT